MCRQGVDGGSSFWSLIHTSTSTYSYIAAFHVQHCNSSRQNCHHSLRTLMGWMPWVQEVYSDQLNTYQIWSPDLPSKICTSERAPVYKCENKVPHAVPRVLQLLVVAGSVVRVLECITPKKGPGNGRFCSKNTVSYIRDRLERWRYVDRHDILKNK